MKASVIVPVWNAASTLSRALESVLGQTVEDLEIVCADDGSSDDSLSLMAGFAGKDSRVKLIPGPNKGTLAARKRAVAASSGDWVLFLDPDDWLEKTAVQTFLDAVQDCDADVVQCGMYLEESSPVAEEWQLAMDMYFNRPAAFFTSEKALDLAFSSRELPWNLIGKFVRGSVARKAFEEHSDAFATMSEDACSMFRILLHARSFKVIVSKLYHYRIGGGISTRERLSMEEVCKAFGVFKELESLRKLLDARAGQGMSLPACAEDFFGSVEDAGFAWVFDRLESPEEQAAALDRWRIEVGDARFYSILSGMYSRMSRAKADAIRADGELRALENSRSYRLGRWLSAPLRMAVSLFTLSAKDG